MTDARSRAEISYEDDFHEPGELAARRQAYLSEARCRTPAEPHVRDSAQTIVALRRPEH